jgi:Spy/CpxP family protein refolding chaperone
MNVMRSLAGGCLLLAVILTGTPAAAGQQDAPRPPRAQGEGKGPILTPLELERWFDSYVLLQAQDTLKLTDAQFPRFIPRLKALQDTRRRHLQSRRQILNAVGRLAKLEPPDEGQLRDQMKALRDLDVKAADEMRRAYDSLDEVLDPVQQARFRLFEDQVERRKIDLLMKARQRVRDAGAGIQGGSAR